MNYKLSPSELTFLYDGCKRCFYLKKVHNIAQPSMPFPAIFSKIAGLLKDHYDGKRTEELHPGLLPGIVKYGEKWVESQSIHLPGHNNTCFIKGRFDVVIEFDNGTFGVIDYKTGNPENKYSDLYSRQLHAYAYALENPAYGSIQLSPISMLGLLYFYPTRVSQDNIEWLSYDAKIELIEIEKDEKGFMTFIGDVLTLLELSEYPESASDCGCCKYIREARRIDNT